MRNYINAKQRQLGIQKLQKIKSSLEILKEHYKRTQEEIIIIYEKITHAKIQLESGGHCLNDKSFMAKEMESSKTFINELREKIPTKIALVDKLLKYIDELIKFED